MDIGIIVQKIWTITMIIIRELGFSPVTMVTDW
jgi:hypothetical protein